MQINSKRHSDARPMLNPRAAHTGAAVLDGPARTDRPTCRVTATSSADMNRRSITDTRPGI
ncbi:hypothetical protein I553_7865 [Mycobacterium xenopi 4042]|uniref:Uncharacterized protein n=1 Tax=Mycobacterium xenopi 4042 TaxID=1299334 RepID=X8APB6_MYCXE|nr:hypothetical protein I553_7865 [Mycobacterium xenopi 4042]